MATSEYVRAACALQQLQHLVQHKVDKLIGNASNGMAEACEKVDAAELKTRFCL
jgi:hypothetical protein